MSAITVSEETFERLLDMLDNPPEPTPALRKMAADWRTRYPLRTGTITLSDGTQFEVRETFPQSGEFRILR